MRNDEPCSCGVQHLRRVRRKFWLRLLPWRRLYACGECGRVQLIDKRIVEAGLREWFHEASFRGESTRPVLEDV